MRAIALSLGQDVNSHDKEMAEAKKKEEEDTVRRLAEEKEREHREMEPLSKAVLDEFSSKLLPGCLELASTIPESVYRVCDLISALAKRSGQVWRDNALTTLHDKVHGIDMGIDVGGDSARIMCCAGFGECAWTGVRVGTQ